MRILFISKPYVARPYREKLRLLAATPGVKIGLICPPAWGHQVFEPPSPDETRLLWIRSLPIAFADRNHFHYYRGLEQAIGEFRPDVINVEEEDYSFVTWQVFRVAKKLGVPALFYAWQNIDKRYPPPFSWFQQTIYGQAAGAMGGSHNAERIVRRKGYRGPFAVIPQIGIDFSVFRLGSEPKDDKAVYKKQLGIDPKTFVLYFAGRIVEEKGVQTIIAALAELKDLRSSVLFLCVGSGPYAEKLHQLAAQYKVEDRIRFIPHVAASEIAKFPKAADVLCLASLTRANWMEQGPVRVVTESMAARAVAVVSDSGELPDVVADCGRIFPEGDAQALAEHLGALAADRQLCRELGVKGQLRAEQLYSANAVARNCFAFIQSVVEARA